MSALDDELVEAAAAALFSYWHGPAWDDVQANPIVSQYREQARAVLSVPALRDALARDAQVREIVQSMRTATVQGDVWAVVGRLAALYPSLGDRDDNGEKR
jgi:hypothetical protein